MVCKKQDQLKININVSQLHWVIIQIYYKGLRSPMCSIWSPVSPKKSLSYFPAAFVNDVIFNDYFTYNESNYRK